MACIYIRHNVLFSNEPNITGPPNGYTCGVRVRVQGQLDFMIVNCYTPQPCTSFDWLTELGGKGRCLVTGDFNVRDSNWERDYESSSPTLTAQIDNSDFIVLNDGSFTRSDQRPSAIDLTLVTPDTASGAEWEVGADSLSSDHLRLAVNTPLTCTELRRALASIKKVKVSTGVDTVSYRMLKEAPESFLKILLDFFQRCWDGGTIPAGWKHAIVVPIHKHGKPRKELGSYRPISLTSHLGKVYERVIKNRLEYYCESKKVFPVCQAGFRRGRGVTDHLVKLGEHVGRAIGRRKVLLTCFFYISRAYDQVWHAKLLQKLNKIGISGNMYNFIRSFLSDRSMQVRWKGATSTTKGVSMGVPQGSVIAPLLFNIMVHDVDTAVKGKVVLTMYADDLAIWTDTHFRRLHTNGSWVKQHETVPGSCGRGGPPYASKWIRSLFPENCVPPIPHQHLSEHGGAHQGERAEHLCIERSQVPGCTLHSLGAYEPAGRAQRAERLPSPQRDQGAICSALGQHPQDPSERGAGPGALTPVVRTGSHAPPLENGSSPSHRHRGARSATGPRAAAVRAAVPGVQRGRAPPVPPPHPARL